MSISDHSTFALTWRRAVAVLLVLTLCAVALPAALGRGRAEASSFEPATFDLFSTFPKQMLAPSSGKTLTWMPLDTRNITDSSQQVFLSAKAESPFFNARVLPALVRPRGPEGKSRSWVLVACSPATPEGTVGYVKVTGVRGSEQHHVWLKAIALSSKPELSLSRGQMLTGEGYSDPVLQAFTGRALTWKLAAKNNGGASDTYRLSHSASFPCSVRFLSGGREITEVRISGLTHNYLYPTTSELKVEVTPTGELPENEPQGLTVTLGPGTRTGATSSVELQVVNPGMLFCVNAEGSLRPHPHQVMAGETTSFLFHVTNFQGSPADITLGVEGDPGAWDVALSKNKIRGLAPGATEQVALSARAPEAASPGELLELTVVADSDPGPSESSTIGAEVTDTPNIYYWAIDSMDPEYLYLNRVGTGEGSPGDWLMPNTRAFLAESVNYTRAKVFLPAATDMNHTNALAGTYTGTQGIYMVGGTFRGFTEHNEVIDAPNSMELMRYGPDGTPLERVFEVAKSQTGGKALTGFWSNKNWLANIEGERSVDIVGHSERFPLFFPGPYKYKAAGDPRTDENPQDPMSGTFSMCFYNDIFRDIVIPTLLGQFNRLLGIGFFVLPVSVVVGLMPGGHSEDRYLYNMFERSIAEEDPDVCYINVSDLDNTGHFTGSSWDLPEWDTKGTPEATDDESVFSPWMRRDECLDIAREADVLFGQFIDLLKDRGVYDSSIIVVLSDHGMENVKDKARGFEVLDLREVLRANGLVHWEDYREAGGTQINFIWCDEPAKCSAIEEILEDYTVNDPLLGPVKPLTVINREEMLSGADYGEHGKVRPRELWSEYWINHPDEPDGHLWPDLFIFPLYNYNIAAHGQILSGSINPVGISLGNMPDSLQVGFPGAHGGLGTTDIPLIFKAPAGYPGYAPGTTWPDEVRVSDIAPTIYQILGWPAPGCVDGEPLPH